MIRGIACQARSHLGQHSDGVGVACGLYSNPDTLMQTCQAMQDALACPAGATPACRHTPGAAAAATGDARLGNTASALVVLEAFNDAERW